MSDNELPNQNSGCSEHPMDYLNKAAEACAAGDLTLGMHLYLAAYEKAASEPERSTGMAVAALREAWQLACDLKERSMAEHVFEKLEPYLTSDEISECALELQNLALDRLEEFGFSREDLQDMAEAISQDFMGGEASVVKVEHISIPNANMFGVPGQIIADVSGDVTPKSRTAQDAAELEAVELPVQVEQDASLGSSNPENWQDGLATAPSSSETSREKGAKTPGISKAPVFNPYDMYPESSVGHSWNAATNSGSGWNEDLGFDGTSVLEERFKGFYPNRPNGESTPVGEGQQAVSPTSQPAFDRAGTNAQPADRAARTEGATGTLPVSPASDAQPANAADGSAGATTAASASDAQDNSATALSAAPASSRVTAPAPDSKGIPSMPQLASPESKAFDYNSLVGYDEAVSIMRDYGAGLQDDPGFIGFIEMMNERHGLDRAPSADTVLFRAPAIEDAARFVEATIGELGLPTLRMTMEEGAQGMPVLVVTTEGNNRPRMNRQRNRFEGPAILVISDLDMWHMPEVPESVEGGMAAFVMANMTRGAREAIGLIRSAVEDPNVIVLATASTTGEVEPFFYDVLEPLTIIDIGNPNESERDAIWSEIMRNHPSMSGLDRADLVRYSAGMARYDIYMAAREAIEEAYKLGLMQRTYLPVSAQNVFDKLASCQPFDSDEYRALEERVVSEFAAGLEDLENLLGDLGAQGPDAS